MTMHTTAQRVRNFRPAWPAVLLFTALLAQAPHAAAVFIRIAPHDAQWEIYTSFVGAWVYAIALEGATAYFVWRSKLGWAVAFAVFSIAHNIAYYMPAAWTFDVFGATLTVRYVFSALLISMSLPIAIAAFSHVQAESRQEPLHAAELSVGKLVALQPHTAPPVPPAGQTESTDAAPELATPAVKPPAPARKPARRKTAKPTQEQRRAQIASSGVTDPSAICAQFGVSLRTAQEDIKAVRSALTAQNGETH